MMETAKTRAAVGCPATVEDVLSLPEDFRAELIGGTIVEKAAPTFDHGDSQRSLSVELGPFARRPGGQSPGGWWLGSEVDVLYDTRELYRHDLVGWRRDRVPERPSGRPVSIRPDWACEILSPSNWVSDTVAKFRTLQRHGVPHYWLVDLDHGVVTVYHLRDREYGVAALASRGERARLEPFDAVEIEIGVLFGDEPSE